MEDEIPDLIETESAAVEETKRVPLTLICGFLGAGKSTLLKRILTEKHGYRIAVIMNEFGDTAKLAYKQTGKLAKAIKVSSADKPADDLDTATDEFLELPNGCLCCSIKDTGVAAIEKLMSRKGAFDHILLETTGLADPGPIAAMFWKNEEYATGLGNDIYLDGVICVVDAVFAPKQIEQDEALDGIKISLRQIGAADVILLNKTDLVKQETLIEVDNVIRRANSAAPIYRTSHACIDLSKVMGIKAYSDGIRTMLNVSEDNLHAGHDHSHPHPHPHPHEHPSSFDGISNIIVRIPGPLKENQIEDLDNWIRSVLWDHVIPGHDPASSSLKLEILRCKGIWWNVDGQQFLLQGVRKLYDISELDVGVTSPEEHTGKLVFIGRGLTNDVRDSLGRVVGI